MKKNVLLIFSVLVLFASPSFGQGYEGKGDVMLNLGIGLLGNRGNYFDNYNNYNNYNSTKLPAIISSLEFGVHDYISVGPYLSWQHRWFGYDNGYNYHKKIRESWTNFGARASFHFTSFLNDKLRTAIPENLDLYAGVFLGMDIYHKTTIQNYDYDNISDTREGEASAGATTGLIAAGARYYFSPGFGVFLEVSPFYWGSLNYIETGFAFKF